MAGFGIPGSFFSRGSYGNVWSSSESGADAWGRGVDSGGAQVYRFTSTKSGGLSVRCLRDSLGSSDPLYSFTISTTLPDTGTTLSTGLVGHWTFDGDTISGTTVTDVSGNGNNGTLTNGPTKAIGKLGQALSFDGVNDYVNMGNASSLENVTNLSFSAWVWRNGDHWWGIIGANNADGEGGYQLLTFGADNTLGGYLLGPSGTTGDINTGWLIPDRQWSYVVMTYDGSNVRFYGNGILVHTVAYSGGINNTGATPFRLGRLASFYWKGYLDDVRIYNRALSADEVQQLYQRGLGATVKICKVDSVQDADANTYNTIAIGSQCWLDRNMNVGTRIGSTAQTNNATIEKWCYNDAASNCTDNHPNKPDGGLYQWDEAMQYSTTEGAQGICPTGFHIPTDAEWHTLEKFLTDGGGSCDPSRASSYGCLPAGTKLKYNGSSDFEANLTGANIGIYTLRDTSSASWSSSESGSFQAVYRLFNLSNTGISRIINGKGYGYSVRCIQD